MPLIRITVLILLLIGSTTCRAQETKAPPCGGSDTVDKLGADTAKNTRAFVAHLQELVRTGDKKAIASEISYPLRVNETANGKPTHTSIRSPQQFIAAYDRLLTENVKSAILNPTAIPCLFGNYQGFMIGDGQLWFQETSPGNFHIFALNLS
jgi:hypothetical protein